MKMGLDYYDVSIFATLSGLYREISEALRAAYGLEIEAHELPQVLRFGSWIGGDRDGNPFVTPEVTRDAIQLARGHLLLYYQARLDDIIDLLTTSAQQRPVSKELRRGWMRMWRWCIRRRRRCSARSTSLSIIGGSSSA